MQGRPSEPRTFSTLAPTGRDTSERLLEAWLRAADLMCEMGSARERAFAQLVIEGLAETTRHHLRDVA